MCWHQSFGIAVTVCWLQLHRPVLLATLLVAMLYGEMVEMRANAQPVIANSRDTQWLENRWSELAPIPNPLGVAGPFAGPVGENFVVFGGANFPEAPPWLGGRKSWTNATYLMRRGSTQWDSVPSVLEPLGYGLSIPWNGELLCVGGCDSQHHSSKCYRIGWDGNGLTKASLPDLPKPCAYACGAMVGARLFVAGGLEAPDSPSPMKSVWVLDLARERLDWAEVSAWPGPERMLAVAASYAGEFYLFSGVNLELSSDSAQPKRRYLTDGYCYSREGVWRKLQDVPVPIAAAPGPAIEIKHHDRDMILVMGGDRGDQSNVSPAEHKGFSASVMAYSPKLDQWERFGELPFAHVTTTCGPGLGGYIVPSGEIRPGVRSPKVWLWRPPS